MDPGPSKRRKVQDPILHAIAQAKFDRVAFVRLLADSASCTFEEKPSTDKDYRMELARDKIPKRFPSESWFLEQRPPEVQFCNDHATGLCKVSHTH